MNSVYQVNKGINKSIEFKGLKAQYIWYFGGGVICLLILFAAMYIAGVNSLVCIGVILAAGTGLVIKVYNLSNTYGEYGMMKKIARRSIPRLVRSAGRGIFMAKKTGNQH
jgi:hypothetical protein